MDRRRRGTVGKFCNGRRRARISCRDCERKAHSHGRGEIEGYGGFRKYTKAAGAGESKNVRLSRQAHFGKLVRSRRAEVISRRDSGRTRSRSRSVRAEWVKSIAPKRVRAGVVLTYAG